MTSPLEIKVCIIGDTDVGKTSLSTRFCHGEFPENATPTIGASFLQKRLSFDSCEINLQIWDTAGQERFRSMAPMYYRGAKAAICVFDVTKEESFDRIVSWLRDLKNHADPNVVICIAGNKCDKASTFDLSKCEEYSESIGARFFQTSALSGHNVDAIFNTLATKIVEVYNQKKQVSDSGARRLDDPKNNPPPKSTTCC
jgi:small GTP-binding protein